MRVLYSHYLASDDHPAVRMVQAIAGQLRQRGHEVLVHRCAGAAPESSGDAGTSEHAGFGSRVRGKAWFLKALARNHAMGRRDREVLEHFRPDVVLARQDAYCWSMVAATQRTSIPLVTYADAPVAYETRLYSPPHRWHPPHLVEAIERYNLGHSRAVVTVSHPAARLLEKYRLDVPVHVVPNGVDPESFPVLSAEERTRQRRALGLHAEQVVLFQGSFRPFHGMDTLRSLMLATVGRPDTQWLLIGDGPELPGLRDAVKDRVNAVFLGRRRPEEVGPLLCLADVAVVPPPPSVGEYYFCPLKLLECAAAGCAVLGGTVGDVPHLLDHGRRGVIVPAAVDASSAWIKSLNSLLDSPERRRELGACARAAVLDSFTWAHTAGAVEQVLQTAVKGPVSGFTPSSLSGYSLSPS